MRSPILDEGGARNWSIWNGVTYGEQPCHVPPMLVVILHHLGAFALLAARKPYQYLSFLDFTMWANLARALLMAAQAISMPALYWSKFLTDIPYIGLIALAIFLFRPSPALNNSQMQTA